MAGFVRPKGDHVYLLRGLPGLIGIGLLVIGGIAWLVAGRPNGFSGRGRPVRPAVVAPDDDPQFLERLRRVDPEQEDILRTREAHHPHSETRERDGDDRREPDAPA
jgi:hypothetical protein